ncbi:MAG: type II secretion system protein E [Clostridiales bacterium]|nr:MAG: type II secretion system protein E [Clostridiales bacterium]
MGNNIELFYDTGSNKKKFAEILAEVQEYLASKYATLITNNPEEQRQQLTAYIAKYLNDHRLGAEGLSSDELVERIYTEMAEFSFLTKYLFATDVEELNINSWKDVKITYSDGRVVPSPEKFSSPQHAVDVVRRLLHKSGMILDQSQPGVVGHLSNKIRITVLGNPLTDNDKGVAASIRIVNPQKLSREDFIRFGTATGEMLDFLSVVLRYGLSMCVTGSTGSGKTTLMSWILSTIPADKRVFTIENGCREFDLVKEDENGSVINNVVHTVTRYSEDSRQNIDQEKLLEFALTCNPDIICVGEMKSAEAFAAQEAARTGHSVITTTHANSCSATYYRMVTLCTQKYDMGDKTLHNLVTEAFPIVLFVKKLEDNSRKVMEITECEILPDGSRQLHTLYRYHVSENIIEDGKVVIKGEFQRVNTISESLQKRLLENGMPVKLLHRITREDETAKQPRRRAVRSSGDLPAKRSETKEVTA